MDSCVVDAEHFQVRGELVTTRSDYETPDKTHCYQRIVIRLTLSFANHEIVAAAFAMPKEPFRDICHRLPIDATPLTRPDTASAPTSAKLGTKYAPPPPSNTSRTGA